MQNNLDSYNFYANKLIEIEKIHKQMVIDLVNSKKKSDFLYWIKFSRELDHIKDLYRNNIIDILMSFRDEFKLLNISNTIISDKMKDFGEMCNTKFDEIYDYFESINGLK